MKLLLFFNATVETALLANYNESIKNAKGRIKGDKDGEKSVTRWKGGGPLGPLRTVCCTKGDQRCAGLIRRK